MALLAVPNVSEGSDAARIDDGQSWTVPLLNTAALMALLALAIMSVAARTYNPFIYFRF